MGDVLFAEAAVDAVGEDDQIGIGEAPLIFDLDLELQVDAEIARPFLEDQKKLAPRAAAKAVAGDTVHSAAEMHGDIVPVSELLGDAAVARRIVFLEIVEGGVGKHHAEAERVVGTVALIDRDLGLWPLLFQQNRGVKAGWSAADDRDFHEGLRNGNRSRDILSLKYLLTSPPSAVLLNSPERPASPCSRRRRRHARNRPWSCKAPVPQPRPRSPPRPTSPIPWRASAWSWYWRKSGLGRPAARAIALQAKRARV